MWIGDNRLYKTRTIYDNLNPDFKEEFVCPVAQKTDRILFLVQDEDKIKDDTLGLYVLPATELIARVNNIDARVGVHKTVYLDGKKRHGALEFFVEYLPVRMLDTGQAVPGIYCLPTAGNDARLYVNTDDDGSAPKVEYVGPDGAAAIYEPPRLWRDLYDAICAARHFVYVVGWSVDVDQDLLRGAERKEVRMAGRHSSNIGELLKTKADQGVVVNCMIWDDATSGSFLLPEQGQVRAS